MITAPKTSLSSISHSRFLALVIDHDLDSRLALCGLLESEDCYVIDVENSTLAISAFQELKPDIILLNAVLPETDSFDLCAQIHAMPYDPATPVLMIIDSDDEELIDRALTAGAADYVTKPILPRVLRQRIRRLLHAHQTAVAVIGAKKEWEAAFDAVSDMIILTDLDGKIIRCNLATTQRLKTNYQDLIGDDLGKVFLQARAQKIGLAFGQSLEMQLPALPGWFEVRMFPGQVQGRPHAMVYVFKDITERKRSEAVLAESEERLRVIIETLPIPVLISSIADGTILFANTPLGDTFGLPRDELIGRQTPNFYVDPEDRKVLLGKLRSEGSLHNYELAVKRADNLSFWVLVSGQFVTFSGQQALLTAFYDVTERRRVEENLRTSEARYRTLFEDSPVALWEEDFSDVKAFFDHLKVDKGIADFRAYFETHPEAVTESAEKVKVKDVNKAAMKMLGAEEKEQLLVGLNSIFSFESSDSFREELIHIAEGCENYTFEGVNRALNGTNRYVRVLWSVWPGYEDSLSNVTVSVIDLTERKQAEEMLRETEERLRLIVETIPVPIVISSEADGKIFFANDAMSELIGLPLQELLASHTSDLYFDASQRKHLLETLRKNGQLHNYELILKKADQTPFWVLISMQPLSFANQPALFAALYDVTERKQAEMALRLSEERFQLVTLATNDAVWDLNLETGERWWNAGLRSLFGYGPNQVTNDQEWWKAQIHPDDRSKVLQSFEKALADKSQFWSKEYRYRNADQTYAYVFDRGYIMLDEHGQPVRVIGAMMDITERKHMEEALIKSEEFFSKAFHASPAPMAITRVHDGVFIDANGSWERLLKYKRDAIIGRSLQDFNIIVNPSDRLEIIQRIREQGKVDDYEIKVRNQSGEELNLLQSAQIVEIEDQECLLSTFYDITQLQQLHQAMLASQKLADLGTLAAGVAHEMNSPLQVITGVSQSLLRKATNGVLDPEQLKYNLDVIHRNGWRCAEIVRSLHTYARASGGAKQPADLNGLIHDCLLLIEHQLKSWAGIIVVTELAPDLPLLPCDHNQITQVLINLLTNARDAMPQGGDITISTAHDAGTDELILRVRDSGSGIPSSVLTKIFDPFFTTKALGQGSGLGLSISAGIIRAHGGTIEVDTTVEQGTTFTMRFPTRPISLPGSDSTNIAGRFDEATPTPPTNQFGSTPQETSHA